MKGTRSKFFGHNRAFTALFFILAMATSPIASAGVAFDFQLNGIPNFSADDWFSLEFDSSTDWEGTWDINDIDAVSFGGSTFSADTTLVSFTGLGDWQSMFEFNVTPGGTIGLKLTLGTKIGGEGQLSASGAGGASWLIESDNNGDIAFDFYSLYMREGIPGQAGHTPTGAPVPLVLTAEAQQAAVPVPAAAWLLGFGLLALPGFSRRKKA